MKLNLQIFKTSILTTIGLMSILWLWSISCITAQTTVEYNPDPVGTTTTYTWNVPDNVNSITIQAWGGGGAGGNGNFSSGSAGGGGGGYVKGTLAVTPGTTYAITVGAGGTRPDNTADGRAGGNTSIIQTATSGTILTANGGKGATDTGSGAVGGGSSAPGLTNLLNMDSGENGANRGNNGAGGKGGKGGGIDGGAGGAGGNGSTNGGNGAQPGGGGGGASSSSSGGYGGDGRVIITYSSCETYAIASVAATSSLCTGIQGQTDIAITGTTGDLPEGDYTITYKIGSDDTPQTATVFVAGTSATTGNFNVTITDPASDVTIYLTNIKNMATECENSIFNTVTVPVNSLPVLNLATSTATICSAIKVPDPGLSSNVNGTAYTITADVTGGTVTGHTESITGLSAFHDDEILTNTGIIPGIVTYTITPIANGCPGTAVTYDVTVNPIPVASFTDYSSEDEPTSGEETICTGTTVLDPGLVSTVEGTTYDITSLVTGNVTGNTPSVSGVTSFTPLDKLDNTAETEATVTYTIIPTANGCVGTPIYLRVIVNPVPEVLTYNFINQVLCSEDETVPIVFHGVANKYEWIASGDAILGMPVGVQVGEFAPYELTNNTAETLTATITVTPIFDDNTEGEPCKGEPESFTVTVYSKPKATISSSDICEGEAATLTFTLTAGTPPWSVTYQDDLGNSETIPNITTTTTTDHVTPPVGTTIYEIIRITDGNACINNDPE